MRVLVAVALMAATAAVAVVLLDSGDGDYRVQARFENASQLVKGNNVQVAGTPVGTVESLDLAPDGMALVELRITAKEFAPLRRGTQATIRQASLSGVANRYVDLRLPPGEPPAIPGGGVLESTDTASAVDLDQLFNTFDPESREALSGVIQGLGASYDGRSEEAARGWLYLNPSLAASSRLFSELNRDTRLFERFITASSSLVTDVAERRDDLATLVDRLATTVQAIGSRKEELADAIGGLPPFMRRANTTFVNLRAALDDLAPLVEESKPAARQLRPLLAQLRPFSRDARPTLRNLSRLVRTRGPANDLIEATRSNVAVRDAAVRPTRANGAEREGAFPASVRALEESTPELAAARPYAVDLTGWFDDFSHSGFYDALGGASRAAPHVNAFSEIEGVLGFLPPDLRPAELVKSAQLGQRNRCPGAAERGAAFKPTPDFNCDLSQVPPGP